MRRYRCPGPRGGRAGSPPLPAAAPGGRGRRQDLAPRGPAHRVLHPAPAGPRLGAPEDLPPGYRAVPASEAADLHVSLRGVVRGPARVRRAGARPGSASTTVDTVRTSEFTLADRSGKHPQLFGTWTVLAAGPGGAAQRRRARAVRQQRSAHPLGAPGRPGGAGGAAGGRHSARGRRGRRAELRRALPGQGGKDHRSPGTDRMARESAAVREPWRISWAASGRQRRVVSRAKSLLSPGLLAAMVGSLKVDGKDAFAKALRASPTRFAGPAYQGGGGSVTLRTLMRSARQLLESDPLQKRACRRCS